MKKSFYLLPFLLSVVIILTLVQVIVSNVFSTKGIGLDSIEQQTLFYKKQNALIKEKLLEISSLTYISSSANKIGFIEENNRIFISSPLPLAIKQ